MKIHDLKRHSPQKKKRLVGRGGKRGKTSGKGTKGQKARAGRKMRPELRDLIKKIPKLRGYKFSGVEKQAISIVSIATLQNVFNDNEAVNPKTLVAKKAIYARKGTTPLVKILGDGELSKKLSVSGCLISVSARDKIKKAGGSITEKVSEPAKK